MIVLPEEREWAVVIKRAVLEADHLHPLSDYEYVQYAIISQGDIHDALERISAQQTFKTKYHIDDSVDQGRRYLGWVMNNIPGFVLYLDNHVETNESIIAWECSVFNPKEIMKDDKAWEAYMTFSYYLYSLSQPTFASIRAGIVLLLDCAEVEWKNVSMEFQQRTHEELRNSYPFKYKRVLAYNTHLIANLGWSLFKKIMSPTMRDSLQLGCRIDLSPALDGPEALSRLRQLLFQPSQEVAQTNILRRAGDLLAKRVENVSTFKL